MSNTIVDPSPTAGRQDSITPPTQTPELSIVDAKRVVHWIELAMKQFYPDVAQDYAIEVPTDQPELAALRNLGGVTHLEAVSSIQEGMCRFRMIARNIAGPIDQEFTIKLVAHPEIVVPTRSMGRGHRIEASDLEMRSMAPGDMDRDMITDINVLVGQEVRSNLRVGQAIKYQHFGSPILIHRGDLIEVRVIGGGVNVTTNAKALGDGSESDLIEVETMNPRKRLLGRVARQGVVEIVTRSPIVR